MSEQPIAKRVRLTVDNEDSIAWLESQRYITPITKQGYRSISVSAYSPVSSSSSDRTTEIPEYASSQQTLQQAGFSESAAAEVFSRWKELRVKFHKFDPSLDVVACDMITEKAREHDACSASDDYEAAWIHMGLEPGRARRMAATEHQKMRLLDSAAGHFKASVRDVFDHVFSMAGRINRQRRLQEERAGSPSPTAVASPAIRNREHGSDMQTVSESGVSPQVQAEVALPTEVEGHTLMFKGADLDRLERIWQSPDSSKISVAFLASIPPTDFDRLNTYLLYFAQHLETAEDYCSWAAVRSPSLRHGIMHIAVPNELLDTTNCKWIYDEDWRQLVWESRGPLVDVASQMWRPSAALQHYTDDKSMNMVLAGKICNTCDKAMEDLPGPHAIAEMPLNAGGKAQQYAFFHKAYAKLDDGCEGRVWIEERDFKSNNTTEQSSGKGMYRAKQEGA